MRRRSRRVFDKSQPSICQGFGLKAYIVHCNFIHVPNAFKGSGASQCLLFLINGTVYFKMFIIKPKEKLMMSSACFSSNISTVLI